MCFRKIPSRSFLVGRNGRLVFERRYAEMLGLDVESAGTSWAGLGWLDRLRIAIVDYDRMLFLSVYES